MTPLLRAEGLTVRYASGDKAAKAVDGVSFEIHRAETVAFVGESGCGKTTAALSVLRLLPDQDGASVTGSIFWCGKDLLKTSQSEIRKVRGKEIAMVFQEPMTSLNPVIPVGRQVTEVLELHRKLNKQEARREAARLLEETGIAEAEARLNAYPHELSGGMRQRVMIAMAMSCRPKLIVADEPTTAVDVTIQLHLLELLTAMTRTNRMALMLISHNLGLVARYASRIYVMYAGRIVEHGSATDIFHDPRNPYTVGLLASIPRLDEPRKQRLAPMEGQTPDMALPPVGCAFAPRCSFSSSVCSEGSFDLVEVTPGHFSICRLARQGKGRWQVHS
ncbi:MAG: ABC transporter ATP-binding protein [Chloroflexi bacterium]|nr:ABC transporter ATP-binding protein [Chloroflexota bacterium]